MQKVVPASWFFATLERFCDGYTFVPEQEDAAFACGVENTQADTTANNATTHTRTIRFSNALPFLSYNSPSAAPGAVKESLATCVSTRTLFLLAICSPSSAPLRHAIRSLLDSPMGLCKGILREIPPPKSCNVDEGDNFAQ